MRAEDFDRLYSDHARPLLAFLTYRTGNPAEAEDLVADTFERVLRSRAPFDPRRASKKTWIYTIALNLLRDRARRATVSLRAQTLLSGESSAAPDPGIGLVETRAELADALAALSPEEREVVALRYGADLTVPEIARVTRERLTTVDGRLYRALGKLHDSLSQPD